jgi:hypothetical protein
VLDGALIGAAVGFSMQVLPALTALIATNHPHEATAGILGVWLASIALGAIVGAMLARVWGRHVSTSREGAGPASGPGPVEEQTKA